MSLPDIRERDFSRIRAFQSDLASVGDWEGLIDCAMYHLRALVACDCFCWNEWSNDFGALKRVESHDQYASELAALERSLDETVAHHPLIAQGRLLDAKVAPARLSDYQCSSVFRSNALYREVYRHLDADYQIAYIPAATHDTTLIVSINRRRRDFGERELQVQQLACDAMGPTIALLSEIEAMGRMREAIGQLFERKTGLSGVETLSLGEARLVSGLASGRTQSQIALNAKVRRDTIAKRLEGVREKLGVTDTSELMVALRMMREGRSG